MSLGRRRRHVLDTRGRIAVYSPTVIVPRSPASTTPTASPSTSHRSCLTPSRTSSRSRTSWHQRYEAPPLVRKRGLGLAVGVLRQRASVRTRHRRGDCCSARTPGSARHAEPAPRVPGNGIRAGHWRFRPPAHRPARRLAGYRSHGRSGRRGTRPRCPGADSPAWRIPHTEGNVQPNALSRSGIRHHWRVRGDVRNSHRPARTAGSTRHVHCEDRSRGRALSARLDRRQRRDRRAGGQTRLPASATTARATTMPAAPAAP